MARFFDGKWGELSLDVVKVGFRIEKRLQTPSRHPSGIMGKGVREDWAIDERPNRMHAKRGGSRVGLNGDWLRKQRGAIEGEKTGEEVGIRRGLRGGDTHTSGLHYPRVCKGRIGRRKAAGDETVKKSGQYHLTSELHEPDHGA